MGGQRTSTTIFASVMLGIAVLGSSPAAAQFSESYNFLKSVRDGEGDKVTKALQDSGSTLINTRDYNTGEGALMIVVKRRDLTWVKFLLAKGANPNIKDNAGQTPLIAATQIGFSEAVSALLENGAQINASNSRGETPLILAAQARDVVLVRLLLSNGADSRLADRIAGKSARDYAAEDPRAAAVLKAINESSTTVKAKPQLSGPGL